MATKYADRRWISDFKTDALIAVHATDREPYLTISIDGKDVTITGTDLQDFISKLRMLQNVCEKFAAHLDGEQ